MLEQITHWRGDRQHLKVFLDNDRHGNRRRAIQQFFQLQRFRSSIERMLLELVFDLGR